MIQRRARGIEILFLGIGTDELVEIAGLELVGVLGQGFQLADSVVARARFENVVEGERRKRGVAAGAAAADDQAVAVDPSALRQPLGAVDAVLHVDDTPLAVEAMPIGPAVARAAAVVDVQHGKTAAGPVLDRQPEADAGRARRTAVTNDDQRRRLTIRVLELGINRRIEKTVCLFAISGRETQ